MTFAKFMLTYGTTIISIVITILSLILAYIKARKSGNTKGMLAILEKIPSLVTTAESLYGAGKGSAKLDYVLTQLRLYALQNNIKVDAEELTAQVNSVVETTKNVNVNTPTIDIETDTTAKSGASVESGSTNTQTNINI